MKSIYLIIIVTVIYYCLGELGLTYAHLNGTTSPLWPPSGLGLAALLIYGNKILPAIGIGSFLFNFAEGVPVVVAIGLTIGNIIEPILSKRLLTFFRFNNNLKEQNDILRFVAVAGVISPLVATLIGVSTLSYAGFVEPENLWSISFIFFSGNSVGALVFTPFILEMFSARNKETWKKLFNPELVIIAVFIAVMSYFIVDDKFPRYPLFPLVTWAALRFGVSGVSLVTLIHSTIALYSINYGFLPHSADVILTQGFITVLSVTGYLLASTLTARIETKGKELEKKRVEESLFILEQAISSSPVGFALVDQQLKYIKVNDILAEISGVKAEEHIGKLIHEVMGEEFGDIVAGHCIEVFSSARPVLNVPVAGVNPNISHDTRSGLMSYYPVKNPANSYIFAVAVSFQDLTKQHRIEKLLRNNQIELRHALWARDEFIAVASHELKTPLTTLKLQAQLQLKHLHEGKSFSDEKIEKVMTSFNWQLDKITRLVNDMLEISRISCGRLTLEKKSCNLVQLVHEIIKRHESQFIDSGSGMPDFYYDGDFIGVWDELRIEQVISNLIGNAIKHASGSRIRIALGLKGNQVEVSVADNGPGISKHSQQKIFERFERAETNDTRGLGLGLYISRQIILAHGGAIRVESDIGKGAEFVFTLPVERAYESLMVV